MTLIRVICKDGTKTFIREKDVLILSKDKSHCWELTTLNDTYIYRKSLKGFILPNAKLLK